MSKYLQLDIKFSMYNRSNALGILCIYQECTVFPRVTLGSSDLELSVE